MRSPLQMMAVAATVVTVALTGCRVLKPPDVAEYAARIEGGWQQDFGLAQRTLKPTGRNDFLILEPGFQTILEGEDERVVITVLDETKAVNGVTTRVVEEREWKKGKLVEVSRNFLAICADTKDVFYFGEEVDEYKDGKITGHGGTWLAGEKGAKAGLLMPGQPRVGMRYFQEIAAGVAMDRAEVISLDETVKTPAGTFAKCLKTQEGSTLNSNEKEFKLYAPGIGQIKDGGLLLTKYGVVRP
jgi:hypothetical protein